jgi:hypothetical protein
MISCLLAGMDKNSQKQVNYDKIKKKKSHKIQIKILSSFLIASWRQWSNTLI